ncbi:hypothetical protein [cf. Phormidesmis sp. LEGE 11477]|uniref:hypothetical protein n=1 Tax=cf. Phormidesmis sp. LEGE 11477 TaxID=1828680 RepID=UPI00187F4D71|nr:hypothetical protein [cf. Phormidesmis sp. LEGE 11477]MBE9063521.1 hypothetical protein [cf. Phormidesmis sp. LEGE 11477]
MKSFYRLAVGVCIALVMLSLMANLWSNPVKASSPLNESRIRQLEFQVRSLQNQISQIQSRPTGGSTSAPPVAPIPAEVFDGPSPQEQFDNLATLVIEINQRVQAIEQQLSN